MTRTPDPDHNIARTPLSRAVENLVGHVMQEVGDATCTPRHEMDGSIQTTFRRFLAEVLDLQARQARREAVEAVAGELARMSDLWAADTRADPAVRHVLVNAYHTASEVAQSLAEGTTEDFYRGQTSKPSDGVLEAMRAMLHGEDPPRHSAGVRPPVAPLAEGRDNRPDPNPSEGA